MSKVINSICDTCDSEFTLTFDENLVTEHTEVFCPFCKTQIDSVEEDIQDEYDLFQDNWDE